MVMVMGFNRSMFSSQSGLWSTPQDLFDLLDQEFAFDIDVCAIPENAKCSRFFTPAEDGLVQVWRGNCWCNPPYGKDLKYWVEKAYWSDALVVMLLPARVDTKWFHKYCLGNDRCEIRFLDHRLKFGEANFNAPFPSMLCIFRNSEVL